MGATKTLINWMGDKYEKKLDDELARVYARESAGVAAQARTNAPGGDSGELAASIDWDMIRTKSGPRAWIGPKAGSPAADYAARVEFGFNYLSGKLRSDALDRVPIQEPQPYLSPALNASRPEIMRAIRKAGERTARSRFTKGVFSVVG